MGIIEESIKGLVLNRTENWNFNEIVLNGDELTVLAEINGRKTLGTISKKLDIMLNDLEIIVEKLGGMQLIMPVELTPDKLPESKTSSACKTGSKSIHNNLSHTKHRVYRGVSYRVA